MNKVILIGNVVRDPEIRKSANGEMVAARYSLAVSRNFKNKDGNYDADFINCTAFNTRAAFAEKYLHKGMKIAVIGRIQTGSYTDKDGKKVYTTDVIVDEHEFVEKKGNGGNSGTSSESKKSDDGFMNIPDGLDDEELPFN